MHSFLRHVTNIFRKDYALINVKDLEEFGPNADLDIEALSKAGLVKRLKDGVKLLGEGEISHPVTIKVHKVSKTAREKIEAAGGKVEIL